jgi:hypothetical protein
MPKAPTEWGSRAFHSIPEETLTASRTRKDTEKFGREPNIVCYVSSQTQEQEPPCHEEHLGQS